MPDLQSIAVELERALRGKVVTDADLSKLTSFRVGGRAAVLADVTDIDDLLALANIVRTGWPVTVLGRGSNVLISDRGFPGIVVRLGADFEKISGDGPIDAGAAASLPRLANYAARRRLTGMEFAVAIPAAVGGAVRMNAGAHGSSMSDVLRSAVLVDLTTASSRTATRTDLEMGYRDTSLAPSEVVCSATFELRPGDPEEIRSLMERYRQHRSETQPSDAPNAGSMFRNPDDDSAGRLIEAAGLKGYRVGGAEVSEKHANFFLARQGAKAQDVFDLMVQVQDRVQSSFGVLLLPEIRMVGEFESPERLRWTTP